MKVTIKSQDKKTPIDSLTLLLDTLLLRLWMFTLLPKLLHAQNFGKITVDEDTGYFVDSRGYVKLFHGINCVPKVAPYYHPSLLDLSTLKLFHDWGINVIRLELNWMRLKPSEGEINYDYLNIIGKIIDNAGQYGIYIIIDLHQDGLSKRLGAIDAVPSWFMDKIPRPLQIFQYPWPLKFDPTADNWFLTYFTYESAHVFGSIYKNVSGTWDSFAEYWKIAAEYFGKKHNLLGYNLINEPPPGNFYTNPLRLIPCKSFKTLCGTVFLKVMF
ncbi:unnamed protein product [Heterobilharzia americana]|nr:unnamed protein product [Heterobilharzia americana]